jgi:hypothetical protein
MLELWRPISGDLSGCRGEMGGNNLKNACVNLLDAALVADRKDASRLPGSNFLIFLVDAAIEIVGLKLKAIFVAAAATGMALVAAAGSTER